MRRLLLCPFSILALFAAGCGSSSLGDGPCVGDAAPGCGVPCGSDTDCDLGFYCGTDGTCTADCTVGGDQCPSGQVCDDRGHCVVGSDGGNQATPGPSVHHEMEIMVEDGGLTPMQVLQAATKWPADVMRVGKEIGTIEVGKLADLVILSANPVELDPKLVKDIVVVETIKEGKTVYRRY